MKTKKIVLLVVIVVALAIATLTFLFGIGNLELVNSQFKRSEEFTLLTLAIFILPFLSGMAFSFVLLPDGK